MAALKPKQPKLSKTSKDLIDKFSEDAMDWGWYAKTVISVNPKTGTPGKSYQDSKDDLEKRVLYLETQLKKALQSAKQWKQSNPRVQYVQRQTLVHHLTKEPK